MIKIVGDHGAMLFVALHKQKITTATLEDKYIRSRGPRDHRIVFSTLTLSLNTERQNMARVVLGIVDVRCNPNRDDGAALASWAKLEKLAMVTGYVGSNDAFVEDFASQANASCSSPMCTAITIDQTSYVHPSYYI